MVTPISVSHKGRNYVVQVDLTHTVSSFQAQLEELTSVPIENQKLLFKGKKTTAKNDDTLEIFGLKDGIKVQMLGSTAEEISGLRAIEDGKMRMEHILRDRETQTTRVRRKTFANFTIRRRLIIIFHIEVLPIHSNQGISLGCNLSFSRHPASTSSSKP